jgi:two-component system, cell cycle response regulator DivK
MKKVLIVDDCANVTMLCARLLERDGGYIVQEENCGTAALATALRFAPDLILLDLELCDMPGEDVAEELRGNADLCHVPIIVVTGSVTRDQVGTIHPTIGHPLLPKPIIPDELLRVVTETLNGPPLSQAA